MSKDECVLSALTKLDLPKFTVLCLSITELYESFSRDFEVALSHMMRPYYNVRLRIVAIFANRAANVVSDLNLALNCLLPLDLVRIVQLIEGFTLPIRQVLKHRNLHPD